MKVCFVVNHVAFFASHRLPLAIQIRQYGYHSSLVTGQAGNQEMEKAGEILCDQEGVPRERVDFSTAGLNPVKEFIGIVQLALILRRKRPDVIHCASPKGNLYGAIASKLTNARIIVLSISGMGFGHTDSKEHTIKRIFVRAIQETVLALVMRDKKIRVIVQNSEDEEIIKRKYRWLKGRVYRVPGSGVDLSKFSGIDFTKKTKTVVFAARLLKDKGLLEFIEAAKELKVRHPDWKFIVAGAAGYQNPTAVSAEQMRMPEVLDSVDWIGHSEDMPKLLSSSSIVCLPSYREGMPKILLEAAAAGCAVVTTSVAGCREAVIPGETALIVPARNARRLREAIECLISDEETTRKLGMNGVRLATERFSIDRVAVAVKQIYEHS